MGEALPADVELFRRLAPTECKRKEMPDYQVLLVPALGDLFLSEGGARVSQLGQVSSLPISKPAYGVMRPTNLRAPGEAKKGL